MLELMRSRTRWHWGVFGKHPVSGDFINSGLSDPVLKALSIWVEDGYRKRCTTLCPINQHYSWRFWAQTPHQYLICGIVKDSSDRLGRRFPLLIIGSGPLKKWKAYWDFLPYAFDKTWTCMERLSARKFTDFRDFDNCVQQIPSPKPQWADYSAIQHTRIPAGFQSMTMRSPGQKAYEVKRLLNGSGERKIYISIDDDQKENQSMLSTIQHCLRLFKVQKNKIPTAVFMGGHPSKTTLALFQRPLVFHDFIELWSVGS